jgi:hypothetical protein
LGHHRDVVRHDRGKRAAEDGERAGEDEPWRFLEATTRVEKRARRVDVDSHCEVELRLRLTAYARREVVHHVDIGLDNRLREVVVRERPGFPLDTRIVDTTGSDIDGYELRYRR